MRRIQWLLVLSGIVLLGAHDAVAEELFRIKVAAGPVDRENTPVCMPFGLGSGRAGLKRVSLVGDDGERLVGQVTRAGLLDDRQHAQAMVLFELHFILPHLAAGEETQFTVESTDDETPGFVWQDTPGEYLELRDDTQPVMQYMYRALDESSPAAREQTYKVFHHLFDPSGTRRVTKGPGGLYTHHRGLFYGFNRVTHGNDQADVWHCKAGAHQSHQEHISQEAGPVLGRHQVRLGWHGQDGKTFAEERRELTVYRVPGGHLVEFASRLRSTGDPIRLDGDPQHAGFHFRAENEVAASTKGETYYLRPDGPGQPGETRNWPDQKDFVNLPWNAMSFVLGDQRYTIAYLDRPANPKEARFSERDYGRFGSYFEYDLAPDAELALNYRVWLQEGESNVEEIAARANQFVQPVQVTIE